MLLAQMHASHASMVLQHRTISVAVLVPAPCMAWPHRRQRGHVANWEQIMMRKDVTRLIGNTGNMR